MRTERTDDGQDYYFGRSIGGDGFGIPMDTTPLGLKPRGARIHGPGETEKDLLAQLVDAVQKQQAQERAFLIVQQQAVRNWQLMASFNVPFDYNCISMNVIFGLVCVTCANVVPRGFDLVTGTFPVVDESTTIDYQFGNVGIIVGDTLGTPAVVPVPMAGGMQQERFPIRKAGVVSIWVHGASYLDERHALISEGLSDVCIFSGQISQLRF